MLFETVRRALGRVPLIGCSLLFLTAFPIPTRALDIPLTVRERAGIDRVNEVVTTGVPLAKGELFSAQGARIQGVDAQFQPLATWADGSIKWLLVSFPTTLSAWESRTVQLIHGSGDAPSGDLQVNDAGGMITVTTGPLRFTMTKSGFRLFDSVWMDVDEDGTFAPAERMVRPRTSNGSIVIGPDGNKFTSIDGPAVNFVVEEAGPIRAVVYFEGQHQGSAGSHLEFSGRVFAYRGRSDVRVEYSQVNLTPTDLYANGGQPMSRWLAGQGPLGGSTVSRHFEDLSLVTQIDLNGAPTYTMEGARNRGIETGALTANASLYQDSSGGPYWYVSHGTTFGGYRMRHGVQTLDSAAKAQGFVDVSDGQWGLTVGIRKFWENFPNKLMVDPQGVVTVGLMPADFAEAFEHRSGERKTHMVLFNFHRGTAAASGAADIAAAFHSPLWAIAPAAHYATSGAFDDLVPYDPTRFEDYEAYNAVGADGYLSTREDSDFYGWQDFGDVWSDFEGGGSPPNTNKAANNLEYDNGYGFIQQAVRTAGLNDDLFDKWWQLAEESNTHSADIDVYHVTEGPLQWMWGGMWNHTEHGGTGYSDPHRGDSVNLQHQWNRGLLYWYFLSGDRNVFDSALKVGENATWRIENGPGGPGYSGTQTNGRGPGHALQVITDMYQLTWDQRYVLAAQKLIDESYGPERPYIIDQNGNGDGSVEPKPWMIAILMKNIGRFIQLREAEDHVMETRAIESLHGYADWMVGTGWRDRSGGNPAYFIYQVLNDGTIVPSGNNVNMWTLRGSDAMTYAARYQNNTIKQARYLQVAQHAFEDGSKYPWCQNCPPRSWSQAKVHQIVATSGQEWMAETLSGSDPTEDTTPPDAIDDLNASPGQIAGEVHLTWTAPGDDGPLGRAISYQVRRSKQAILTQQDWLRATPVPGAPIPQPAGGTEAMTIRGLDSGEIQFFCVRAMDDGMNLGGISNVASAQPGGDESGPVLSEIVVEEGSGGSVRFRWITNEPATSEVRWEADWAGGADPFDEMVMDGLLKTHHDLQISGLNAGTEIHYQIRSRDAAGNETVDAIRSIIITSSDPDIPWVTHGPAATMDSTGTNVMVSWHTNERTRGSIEWGTSTAYGQRTPESTNLSMTHLDILSNVPANGLLHYRVRATDGGGNEIIGEDRTFQVQEDTVAPSLEQPIVNASATQAQLVLIADEPSYGAFAWGTNPGALNNSEILSSPGTPGIRHQVLLDGLVYGVTYYFRVSLADPSQNLTVSDGTIYFVGGWTFDTTPPGAPVSLVVRNYNEEFGVALGWAANAEADLAGYELHRRSINKQGAPTSEWEVLNNTLLAEPEFLDDDLQPQAAYEYSVTARDVNDNGSALSPPVAFDPEYWTALQNLLGIPSPNPLPAGELVRLDFRVPNLAGRDNIKAQLSVFDVTGRRVARLYQGRLLPGEIRNASWNGRDISGQPVSSGVYFVRLKVEDRDPVSRKITLLH